MLSFNILYTRDASKKRKRWCDGEFQINTGNTSISSISQLKQTTIGTTLSARIIDKDIDGKACYSGSLPKNSIFSLLIEGDEVKCGSILAQCHDLEPCNPKPSSNPSPGILQTVNTNTNTNINVKSSGVYRYTNGIGNGIGIPNASTITNNMVTNSKSPGIISNAPYKSTGSAYKPFKVPSAIGSCSGGNTGSGSSLYSHNNAPFNADADATGTDTTQQQLQQPICQPLNGTATTSNPSTRIATVPASTSGIISSGFVSRRPVGHSLHSITTTPTPTPMPVHGPLYLLDLPRYYNKSCNANKRCIELPLAFCSEKHYASAFIGSLCEEFRINVADLMYQLESKMSKCILPTKAQVRARAQSNLQKTLVCITPSIIVVSVVVVWGAVVGISK